MVTPVAIPIPALVVSAQPEVRELVSGMLRFAGYHVHCPTSPRNAIDAAAQPGVELIVFDLDYGSFTPELLLDQPALPASSVPPWMLDRQDLRGRFDVVLIGSTPLSEREIAGRGRLGRSVSFTEKPVDFFDFRRALARFVARVQPTMPRPAGTTGAMLAVPSRQELERAVTTPLGPGRYAASAVARPGSEHRADHRFWWQADAVLLGRTEERARIVEISRVGLRVEKQGRELNRGSVVEVAFVERLETGRGVLVVGIRARGRVVWTAEGMSHVHAGLALEAVEPLSEYIQLLVALRALSREGEGG